VDGELLLGELQLLGGLHEVVAVGRRVLQVVLGFLHLVLDLALLGLGLLTRDLELAASILEVAVLLGQLVGLVLLLLVGVRLGFLVGLGFFLDESRRRLLGVGVTRRRRARRSESREGQDEDEVARVHGLFSWGDGADRSSIGPHGSGIESRPESKMMSIEP